MLTLPCMDKKARLLAETPSQKTLHGGTPRGYLSGKARWRQLELSFGEAVISIVVVGPVYCITPSL